MNIEESIKNWVVLDNQHKKLNSQISKLRDEKNELTQTIINYYDFKNTKYPNINISDGKLSRQVTKTPEPLNKDNIHKAINEITKDDGKAKALTEHILNSRKTKEKIALKRIKIRS